MKIALILLSPRKNGISCLLLEQLRTKLLARASTIDVFCLSDVPDLSGYDRIVFSSPVYINALPGTAITFLKNAEQNNSRQNCPTVYLLSNCGFPDGKNNRLNMRIIRSWCARNAFCYGYSIGLGSGPRLFPAAVGDQSIGAGNRIWNSFIVICRKLAAYDCVVFKKNLSRRGYQKTMDRFSEDILRGERGADRFLQPFFPKTKVLNNLIVNLLFFLKVHIRRSTKEQYDKSWGDLKEKMGFPKG